MALPKMNKKIAAGILATGIVLVAGFFGYKTPAADAKLVGDNLQQCEQGCPAQDNCFCNRSCFLAWCWGPYYCQCTTGAEDKAAAPVAAPAPAADAGITPAAAPATPADAGASK